MLSLSNGCLGEPFELRKGVRQGCPLSPSLFIQYMEPVAIRADKKIEGILLPGASEETVKMLQYVDDTTLLLTSDIALQRALDLLREYSAMARALLNVSKLSVKLFGKLTHENGFPLGLQVCVGPIKNPGVWFQWEGSASYNWTEHMVPVQKRLTRWKTRCRFTLFVTYLSCLFFYFMYLFIYLLISILQSPFVN